MKNLISSAYEVYVISPYDKYSKEIENIGCRYINIKMDNKGSNPIKDMLLIYNLYKIYKKIKPDLIIHYTIKPNIYGSFATKLANLRSISIISGLGYTFINDNFIAKVAKFLYKIALKIPKQVWFINEDDKREFIERNLVDKKKVKLINGEGINIEKFKPIVVDKKRDIFIFLVIARILKDKGIYEYIEAIKLICKKYKNVQYELLGSLNALNPAAIKKNEVQNWIDDGVINYLGETSDVRPYIANADCIVLPSYREGQSMALMEAASMETPIIATNVPGCKDIIDDKVNGFICEVKNSKDLSYKMEMMLNLTKEQRANMGKAGREKMIKEFNEKIIIDIYLNNIKKLLQR